jgi:hypothetical protein
MILIIAVLDFPVSAGMLLKVAGENAGVVLSNR